jgi:hypothetical protein
MLEIRLQAVEDVPLPQPSAAGGILKLYDEVLVVMPLLLLLLLYIHACMLRIGLQSELKPCVRCGKCTATSIKCSK